MNFSENNLADRLVYLKNHFGKNRLRLYGYFRHIFDGRDNFLICLFFSTMKTASVACKTSCSISSRAGSVGAQKVMRSPLPFLQ